MMRIGAVWFLFWWSNYEWMNLDVGLTYAAPEVNESLEIGVGYSVSPEFVWVEENDADEGELCLYHIKLVEERVLLFRIHGITCGSSV